VNSFVGHSQVVTTNNCNNLKVAVNVAHKTKYSMYVCQSLLGNESYLVNISQLDIQLLNCLLSSLMNESVTELNSRINSLLYFLEDRIAGTTPENSCFGLLSVVAESIEPFRSKWASASVAILVFRLCLPSRCLANGIFFHETEIWCLPS
jgi:hypothetical protein